MRLRQIPRLVLLTPLLAMLLLVASAASAQMKVAVVDTQRAVMETEDGLRATASLKKLFDTKQSDLDKEQVALQKEREDIEKQSNVLSKAALQKRAEAWQRKVVELQAKFVEYNKELQAKQNQITQPIFQKVMALISRIARQEGFDVVVDKQAVPYVRSDLELTDRIITLYNQGGAEAAAGKDAPKAPVAPNKPQPAPKTK